MPAPRSRSMASRRRWRKWWANTPGGSRRVRCPSCISTPSRAPLTTAGRATRPAREVAAINRSRHGGIGERRGRIERREKMNVNIDKERFGPWALITGASSGIGREFARQLAKAGLNAVLAARRRALLQEAGASLAKDFGVHPHHPPVDNTPRCQLRIGGPTDLLRGSLRGTSRSHPSACRRRARSMRVWWVPTASGPVAPSAGLRCT
jgi:short chain dehydrogenase